MPPARQYYLLLITVVRVYCCTQKMLKETENEETRHFVKFLPLVAFQLRGTGTLGHTHGYAYNFEIRLRL